MSQCFRVPSQMFCIPLRSVCVCERKGKVSRGDTKHLRENAKASPNIYSSHLIFIFFTTSLQGLCNNVSWLWVLESLGGGGCVRSHRFTLGWATALTQGHLWSVESVQSCAWSRTLKLRHLYEYGCLWLWNTHACSKRPAFICKHTLYFNMTRHVSQDYDLKYFSLCPFILYGSMRL